MKIFINEANRLSKEDTSEGEVKWESPSNIAIVKYWGKYGNQFPSNPSFSFTLSAANTKTSIKYRKKKGNGISIHFNFEGKEKESFKNRIVRFLSAIQEYFPFLNQLHLDIESENSFPHSSGIASSASGMSALALCLCDIEKQMFPGAYSEQEFRQKASFISRLGSGSACRSLFPIASVWGETTSVTDSSNYFGIGAAELVHPDFQTFHDDILIVSKAKKSISSSVGHELMKTNRYAKERFAQANDHMGELMHAVSSGDIEKFGMLAEKEALALHALMMCSDPSFILLEGNTIEMIKRIRAFRNESSIPVYFTLDAGPNIHLLYPDEYVKKVNTFIKSELLDLCEDGRIIRDQVGKGPKKLI